MNEKTFIEIWHEEDDCYSNWFATKSVTRWKEDRSVIMSSWQIEGSSIHVYDIEDIKALRKLLNAVEEQLEAGN